MKCKWCGAEVISIHAPLTGSDKEPDSNQRNPDISIHAPLTGSDRLRLGQSLPDPDFNPRSPHRERQKRPRTSREGNVIFQSTLPSQGATHRESIRLLLMYISIHAPLTGSDRPCLAPPSFLFNFNPRSPHRERLLCPVVSR